MAGAVAGPREPILAILQVNLRGQRVENSRPYQPAVTCSMQYSMSSGHLTRHAPGVQHLLALGHTGVPAEPRPELAAKKFPDPETPLRVSLHQAELLIHCDPEF